MTDSPTLRDALNEIARAQVMAPIEVVTFERAAERVERARLELSVACRELRHLARGLRERVDVLEP